jgi:hypothetical protein
MLKPPPLPKLPTVMLVLRRLPRGHVARELPEPAPTLVVELDLTRKEKEAP